MILDDVSLGLHPGDRIGIVGRNGGGKTTLLTTLAGIASVDGGRVTRTGRTTVGLVIQADSLRGETVREVIIGDQEMHEWAGDSHARDVMTGLLGGTEAPLLSAGLDTPIAGMSGGESRRVALAATLLQQPDALLLDEPTNHLDIEAVQWLAGYLNALPAKRAIAVVTHDRWLLDEVTSQTWEVVDGTVQQYDGGYAAFVLSKAERQRRGSVIDTKRRNLVRKELAWLRRGAPARTAKSKFRIDAAEEMISNEPPPRDSLALHRVATARLGKTVLDVENLTVWPADGVPEVLHDITWGLGPGDRIGLLGPNGAGKSTLLRLILDKDPPPFTGNVRRGKTVVPALVDQRLGTVDTEARVLQWLQQAGERVVVTSGDELTSSQLLESFGFTGDSAWKRLGDLSGGELRRLHLLRILLAGPNLLMLDEPTNDLDIETLNVLEDLLDTWPGTLVVVSHDRYFLERVCDDVWALLGDGDLRHLPNGVDEYLERRAGRPPGAEQPTPAKKATPTTQATPDTHAPTAGSAEDRQLRKEVARLERALTKAHTQKRRLHDQFAQAATNPDELAVLTKKLAELEATEAQLEDDWLIASESLN